MHIWENKVPVQNPLLCEEDGPVYQLRRWYEQFYTDVADIKPEMTDRFEFEVDTTKANEFWHAEVADNLAKRAADEPETVSPDAVLRPDQSDTLEEQRLYTQARLVEVACLDCLATVAVQEEQRAPDLDPVVGRGGRGMPGAVRGDELR